MLFTFTPQWKMKIKYNADAPGTNAKRYAYIAPRVPTWQRPALAMGMPEFLLRLTQSIAPHAVFETRDVAILASTSILVPPQSEPAQTMQNLRPACPRHYGRRRWPTPYSVFFPPNRSI